MKYNTDENENQILDPTFIPDGYTREERQRIEQCGQRRRGFLRIWNPAIEQYAPAEIVSPSIEVLRSIGTELAPVLDKLNQTNVCRCADLYHDFWVMKQTALLDIELSKKKRDEIVRQADKQLAQWDGIPVRDETQSRCPFCHKPYQKSIWQILKEEQDAVQRILYLLFGGELDLLDLPYALDYLEQWLFGVVDDPFAKKNLATLTLGMLGVHQLLTWWTEIKRQILSSLLPETSNHESTVISENPGDLPAETLTLDSAPESEISTT